MAAKYEEKTFFSSITNVFSLHNMPEKVRLHGSVIEIWEGVNESYVHPVRDEITVTKKMDTYTLLQSQCIVQLNESN